MAFAPGWRRHRVLFLASQFSNDSGSPSTASGVAIMRRYTRSIIGIVVYPALFCIALLAAALLAIAVLGLFELIPYINPGVHF